MNDIFITAIFIISSVIMFVNIVLTCDVIWNCAKIKKGFSQIFFPLLFLLSAIFVPILTIHRFFEAFSVLIMPVYYITLFLSVVALVETKKRRIIYVYLFFVFTDSLFRSSFDTLLSIWGFQFERVESIDYMASMVFNAICIIIMSLCHKRLIFKSLGSSIELIPPKMYIFTLLIIFLTGGLSASQNAVIDDYELKLAISQIFTLLIIPILLIIIMFLFFNSVSHKFYENISKILERQVEIQVKHYEQIEQLNSDLRGFKHDYNNHTLCLKSMLDAKCYDEAAEYLENLTGSFPDIERKFNTGNYIADALFDEKNAVCENSGIAFDCKGIIPSTKINAVDLCIVLSNLLDNAIDACMKIDEADSKKVNVAVDYKNDFLLIKVSNTVHETVKIHNNFIQTSKEDKSNHGFGLMNINRIVEKHKGDLKMSCENKVFSVEIVLNI
jgi:sensor histidine kinase YesM